MKNKLIFVGLILIILLGLIFGYSKYKENKQAELSTSKDTSNYQLPLIKIATNNEDDSTKKVRLIIGKPIVSILDNNEAASRANSYIERFVLDQKELFYKKVEVDNNSTSSIQNILNTFSLTPKILNVTPKIFIIRFDQSSLFAHKSKSDNLVHYIMFDLDNGKPITFDNLFSNVESINELKKYIQSNNLNELLENDEITSAVKINNHILVDFDGLTIVLDKEEFDFGSAASIEKTIPLLAIENIIDPDLKEMLLTEKEYIRMSEPEKESAQN